VLLDGQDVTAAQGEELRRMRTQIAMVFQQFNLVKRATVLTNVLTGRLGYTPQAWSLFNRFRGDDVALAARNLQRVGLLDKAYNRADALSGGQQQRVGIARSLAVEPEIWFLDEPFSALDPLIRREMQDEFTRLQAVLHKTIVFITHDFDEATRLADRVAIMKDGEIIQVGAPEDLVVNPATAYVAEFTRDAQRAKVVCARTIMSEAPPGMSYAGRVAPHARVASFAADIVGAERPFAVVDDTGAIIGRIDRERVIDLLAGRQAK
jgi:glycine betaine/proline transport system ATP-binding protein